MPSLIASSAKHERLVLGNVKRGHLRGEIADGNAQRIIIAVVGGVDAHRATRVAVAVKTNSAHGADFFERAVAFVVKNKILDGVVGDDQIDPAVAVQIHGHDAQRLAGLRAGCRVLDLDAGLRRERP